MICSRISIFIYSIYNHIIIIYTFIWNSEEDSELTILGFYLITIYDYDDLREANKAHIRIGYYLEKARKDREEEEREEDKEKQEINFSSYFNKKNPERQKKLMIDSCLSEVKREDKEKQEINFSSYFNKKRKNHKFKSLVNTKLVKSLLKNCSDEAKNIINTEIINDQMNGNFSDEEEILVSKRKVIKIDV